MDHYYSKYDDPAMPPSWMLSEASSFGLTAKIYSSLRNPGDRAAIAHPYNFAKNDHIDEAVLAKWMHALTVLRNRCAHHSRITARAFPFKPIVPKSKVAGPYFPAETATLNALIVVMWLLLRTMHSSTSWLKDLFAIFDETTGVDIGVATGFPRDWKAHRIWQDLQSAS